MVDRTSVCWARPNSDTPAEPSGDSDQTWNEACSDGVVAPVKWPPGLSSLPLPLTDPARPRVACFATQGSGHRDEQRIQTLLSALQPRTWPFDHERKLRSALGLLTR